MEALKRSYRVWIAVGVSDPEVTKAPGMLEAVGTLTINGKSLLTQSPQFSPILRHLAMKYLPRLLVQIGIKS